MNTLVSNTGPLIALGGIDRLDILAALFKTVIVPEPVHQEIMQGGKCFTGRAAYQRCHSLQVRRVESTPDPLLTHTLDPGEASVIWMARSIDLAWVLMDEKKGRKVARDVYALPVMGTARVLLEAKRNALIADVGATLQAIRATGYWIHEDIVRRAVMEAKENS